MPTYARTPRLIAVACLSATLLLFAALAGTHSPVGAATTEYVTNPSVETALAPWNSAYNPSSRVERTTGGFDGTYAVRATNSQTASRDVGFRDTPSQVSSTVAGQAYGLSVWVRSEVAGRTISLKAREVTSSGASPGALTQPYLAPDTAWHRIALTYVARGTGNALSFVVFATAVGPNQGFWADLFSASATTPDPSPTGTTQPTATATGTATTSPSVTATVTSTATSTTTPGPGARPNIVVLNLDDMRADSLAQMPKTLQWMAQGGTNFVNGYVSTPSCCPSRATLMSGRYVHNNGQFGQQTAGFDQTLTTQRYLKQAGYYTGHAGKYLHWLPVGSRAPYFDRWMYFKGGYIDVAMNIDGTVRKSSGYSTILTFDQAVNFLNDFESRNDATPWYLSLAPVAPHSPSDAESKYANASVPAHVPDPSYLESDRSDKPPSVRNKSTSASTSLATRTRMTRTLYTVDDQVDRFMKHLQAIGELDNTLMVFTSDNGYLWGEHNLTSKFVPYRKAVEVPLLIRWPGHVAAGAVDPRWVAHVDISPTLLAAAGVTSTLTPMDGHDIFSGYVRPQAFTEYFLDESNGLGRPTWASIRSSTRQYTEYYDTAGAVTFREYYDMVNDPYQLVNLLGDGNPANDPSFASLSTQLLAQRQCAGSACL